MGMPRYLATQPTFQNGANTELQSDINGNLRVSLGSVDKGNPSIVEQSSSDGIVGLDVNAIEFAYGGVSGAGAGMQMVRTPTFFKPVASTAIGSEVTLWTPESSTFLRLMGFTISVSAAVNFVLKDGSGGTTIFQSPTLVLGTPFTVNLGNGILLNDILRCLGSGAANLIGTFWGIEE